MSKNEKNKKLLFTFRRFNGIYRSMKIFRVFFCILILSLTLNSKDFLRFGPYAGYFNPRNQDLKDIYDGGQDIMYGLKLGVRVWRGFTVNLAGYQYLKTSKTNLLEDVTRLTLNPINLSVRYSFPLKVLHPYVELGYTYIYFKEEANLGDQGIGEVKDDDYGYSIDFGIELQLSTHFILDLGGKYSQLKVQPKTDEVDLGGFQVGLTFWVLI